MGSIGIVAQNSNYITSKSKLERRTSCDWDGASALALDSLKWPIQVVADPYSEDDDDSSFSLCRSRSSKLPQESIKHDFPFARLPRYDHFVCILVVKLASTFYHKSNHLLTAADRYRKLPSWRKGFI